MASVADVLAAQAASTAEPDFVGPPAPLVGPPAPPKQTRSVADVLAVQQPPPDEPIPTRGRPSPTIPQRFVAGMVKRGWTPAEAAATAGNMDAESGWQPGVVNSIGAIGLGQMLGPRKRGLMRFAQATGREWQDLETQMDWLHAERTGESTKYGGSDERMSYQKAFPEGGGPREMAYRFGAHVERPSPGELAGSAERRTTAAARAFPAEGEPERIGYPSPAPTPKRSVADVLGGRETGAAAGAGLGDVFRRDKERAETPEFLRRPEEPEPEPPPRPDEAPPLLKRPGYEPAPPGAYGVPTRLEEAALMGARIGVPLATGITAGALSGPGGVVTVPLLTSAASTATELGAQKYETARGLRREVSPGGVAFQGALGALPGVRLPGTLGPVVRTAARAGEGVVMGTGGTAGTTLIEEGRWPTAGELAYGGGMGLLLGTAGGAVEAKGVPFLHERSPSFVGPPTEKGLSRWQLRATERAQQPPRRSVRERLQTLQDELDADTQRRTIEPQRMVTEGDEFIEGGPAAEMTPHPVGSDVLFRDIGEEERTTPGKIVAHDVDPDTGEPIVHVETADERSFVRHRPMADVELAPGAEPAAGEFVGPPEAPVPAYHGTVKDFESLNAPAYLSDTEDVARGFADRRFAAGAYEGEGAPRVSQYAVQFKNPLVIDAAGEHAGNIQFATGDQYGFRRALDPDSPYDGVVIRNTADEGTVYVIKQPGQARPDLGYAEMRTGAGSEAPPPPPPGGEPPGGGMRPETAFEPPPDERGPFGERPTFRKYPGLGEALTGEEIGPQLGADPERMTRAIESIDREFSDVLDEPAREALKQQVRDNQGRFEYLGRGKQTMERTQGLGRDLLFDLEAAKLEPKGTTWSPEQTALAKNHIAALDQGIVAAQEAFDKSPTPQNGLILQKAVQDQIDAFMIYRARGAEAGRTVNIYKASAEDLASGNQRLLLAALKRGVPPDKLAEIIRSTRPEQAKARAEMLMAVTERGPWHQRLKSALQTIYISNILSGPPPHQRNTIGNSINAMLLQPVAKGFGALHERVTGVPDAERTVRMGEAGAHYVGLYDGVPDAVDKSFQILKHGYTQEQARSYDLPIHELGVGRHPALRTALNIVPRGLGSMDMFARVVGQEASLNGQAYTKARNQALVEQAGHNLPDGVSFRERLDQLYDYHQKNPTPETMNQAAGEATRGVFQEQDRVARTVQFIRDQIPGGWALAPFVTTSTNLAKLGLHWSPAGYLMPSTRGKVEGLSRRSQVIHLGEAHAGTAGIMLAPAVLWAMGGKLHGSGPEDPDEFAIWRQTHVPNSLELPNGFAMSFQAIPALNIPLSAVGNMWDRGEEIIRQKGSISPEDADELAAAVIGGTVKSVLDQPYMQGLSNLMDVMRHPTEGRYWNRLAKDISTGFVPASGLLRWIEQIGDPTIREGKTIPQKIQGMIPGLSEGGLGLPPVPPKLDEFGQPIEIKKAGGAWGRAINPIETEYVTRDPLREELAKHGMMLASPGAGSPEKGEAPYTEQEGLVIREAKGQQVRVELEDLIASDAYQEAEPDEQLTMLKSVLAQTRGEIGKGARMLREEGLDVESLRW